jgi:hypothetical protein
MGNVSGPGPRVSVSALPTTPRTVTPLVTPPPAKTVQVTRAEHSAALLKRQAQTSSLFGLTDTQAKLKALKASGNSTTAAAIDRNVQSSSSRFGKALLKTLGGVVNNLFKYGVSYPLKLVAGTVELLGGAIAYGPAKLMGKDIDVFDIKSAGLIQEHLADNKLSDILLGKTDAAADSGDGAVDLAIHLMDKEDAMGDRLTDIHKQISHDPLAVYRDLPDGLGDFNKKDEFGGLFAKYCSGGAVDPDKLKRDIETVNAYHGLNMTDAEKSDLAEHVQEIKGSSQWDADDRVVDPDGGDIVGIVSSSIGVVKSAVELGEAVGQIQKGRETSSATREELKPITARIKEINRLLAENPERRDAAALLGEKTGKLKERHALQAKLSIEQTLGGRMVKKGAAKTVASSLSLGQSIMSFGKFAAEGFRSAGHVAGKIFEPVMNGINFLRDGHSVSQNHRRLNRIQAYSDSTSKTSALMTAALDKQIKAADKKIETVKARSTALDADIAPAKAAIVQAQAALDKIVSDKGLIASPPTTPEETANLAALTAKEPAAKALLASATTKHAELALKKADIDAKVELLTTDKTALTDKKAQISTAVDDTGTSAALDAVELMRKNQKQARSNKIISTVSSALKFAASATALALGGVVLAGIAITPVGWVIAGAGLAIGLGMGVYQVYKNDRRSEHIKAMKAVASGVEGNQASLQSELSANKSTLAADKASLIRLLGASPTASPEALQSKSQAFIAAQDEIISTAKPIIQNNPLISAQYGLVIAKMDELETENTELTRLEGTRKQPPPAQPAADDRLLEISITAQKNKRDQVQMDLSALQNTTIVGTTPPSKVGTALSRDELSAKSLVLDQAVITQTGLRDAAVPRRDQAQTQSDSVKKLEAEIPGKELALEADRLLGQLDPETATANLLVALKGSPSEKLEAEYVLKEIFHINPEPLLMDASDQPKLGEALFKLTKEQLSAKLGMFYSAS